MDKILYKGESCSEWGEYELDYVYFLKKDFREEEFKINREEISEW